MKTIVISADSVMFLINALYLKADWEEEFEKMSTFDDNFHVKEGVTKQVSQNLVLFSNNTPTFQYINSRVGKMRSFFYTFSTLFLFRMLESFSRFNFHNRKIIPFILLVKIPFMNDYEVSRDYASNDQVQVC